MSEWSVVRYHGDEANRVTNHKHYTTMKTQLLSLGFIFSRLLIASSTAADLQDDGSMTDADLLLARNPIIIRSRVRAANEFTDIGGSGNRDKLILGGVYGFGFNGPDRDFAIGFELPFLQNNPEQADTETGLGDFKLRCGQICVDEPKGLRAGWFFDTEFDTAENNVRSIANQRDQMALGGGASFPVWHHFTVTSTLQYGWSLDEGETTGDKSEWEAHLTASAKVSESLSINLDYKAVINAIGGATVYNTLEPSLGWTLGEKKDLGLFASWEIPLDETGVNWVAKIGTVWFF